MERPRVSFTLDKNILSELDEIAKELGAKKSHIVEQALEMYFDAIDTMIADKRLDEIAEGKMKVLSLAEFKKELGL
ncbi:MAG TPA: ribbon-helix-helix domain-containing protein [Candidatus Rifleibacterium sp.]|nr:ribbon-helix-helix domain-containing protein [Candidatus Rifleibacterium sp.]HPT45581.1 ribbon-helix-helix domain-containing protein [Candidatus Rifleibacterium sp.]